MTNLTSISELSLDLKTRMRGVTWHTDLPSPSLEDLRLLRIPFVDFEGRQQIGQLITVGDLAKQVLTIFSALHALAFPIASMHLMHKFRGDDGASMAANNSSCFNSRRIVNSTRVSLHALGRAIDINPVQNPVIRDGKVRPDAGLPYRDRTQQAMGMIHKGGEVVRVFAESGWKWGGDWKNPKDYHHFFLP